MKKAIYISAFIIVCHVSAFAQKARMGYYGGLGGGIVVSNIKTEDAKTDPSSSTGPTFGIIWEMPLCKSNISFQPSLNYVAKGYQQDLAGGGTNKLKINDLEAQFNFIYNAPGTNGHFFIGAGPSAALAINGRWILEKNGKETKSIVVFGNHVTDDFNKFDFGVTVLGGFKFSKAAFISAFYNQGISSLHPNYGDYLSVKSTYFGAKLGFLIKQ
jgi:hypothetical protein